jgi:hypothetical protein
VAVGRLDIEEKLYAFRAATGIYNRISVARDNKLLYQQSALSEAVLLAAGISRCNASINIVKLRL